VQIGNFIFDVYFLKKYIRPSEKGLSGLGSESSESIYETCLD